MGYLVGDCLIAAGFLSYAGPFLSEYREELVQQIWLKQVRSLFLTPTQLAVLPQPTTLLYKIIFVISH